MGLLMAGWISHLENARRHREKQARKNAVDAERRRRIKSARAAAKCGPVKIVYQAKPVKRSKPKPKPQYPIYDYRPGMPADEFYRCRSWLELRYAVLAKRGSECECCGLTRAKGVVIHVDHIRPRSKFPQLELVESNLQVLCDLCNIGKSNKHQTDWRKTA